MIGPLKPFSAVSLAGFPLGLGIGAGLLEFRYRDVHHGEVDEIEFGMADPAGIWRGSYGPEEGTPVTATIGYLGALGGIASCGTYEIDEPEAEGGADGDRARFRGLSAITSAELRTDRSEAYDDTTLKAIVEKIAKRHQLKLIGPIPDLTFRRITQSKTSDLQFLLRLANDWGCYCCAKGDTLVFADRVSIDSQAPAHLFDILPGLLGYGLLRYQLRRSSRRLYPKSELKYLDPKSKKTIIARGEDARIKSGDTLVLDDKVENQGQADRMAVARLLRENDDWSSGTIEVVGRPYLVAGQVVQLGPTFGRFAGRWLVRAAEHMIDTSGYITSIEIRGL